MKLFRAFPKPLERVPDWSNCCNRAKKDHQKMIDRGEIILDMDTLWTCNTECTVCGSRAKEPSAIDVIDGCRVHLEDCDIDEVEYVGSIPVLTK